MPSETLTENFLRAAAVPKSGAVIWYDQHKDAPRGFGARVTAQGKVTFLLNYRVPGAERRMVIGQHGKAPLLSVVAARRKAAEVREQILAGTDPLAAKKSRRRTAIEERERRRQELNFADAVEQYLRDYGPLLWDGGARYGRLLRRFAVPDLGTLRLGEITRLDVRDLVLKVKAKTPIQANRLLAAISSMLSDAVARELVPQNVCLGLNPRGAAKRKGRGVKAPENARERVLDTARELRVFWRITGGGRWARLIPAPVAACLRLMLLTGLRPGEASGLTWKELRIEEGEILLPGERTKNSDPLLLRLPDEVLALVRALPRRGLYVFPGARTAPHLTQNRLSIHLARACRRLQRIGIEPFRPHDLRRSCETGMAGCGVAKEIRDRVLNHRDASVGATHYNKFDFAEPKRLALTAWAATLRTMIDPAPGANVVQLRRGAGQ